MTQATFVDDKINLVIISFKKTKTKSTKNDVQNPPLTSSACCVFASGAHYEFAKRIWKNLSVLRSAEC